MTQTLPPATRAHRGRGRPPTPLPSLVIKVRVTPEMRDDLLRVAALNGTDLSKEIRLALAAHLGRTLGRPEEPATLPPALPAAYAMRNIWTRRRPLPAPRPRQRKEHVHTRRTPLPTTTVPTPPAPQPEAR